MKALLAAAVLLVPALARAQNLAVTGLDGTVKTYTTAQLAAMPQVEITVTERDSSKSTFKGPSLRALMTLAGGPEGHDLRGPNMLIAVVAEASDGYKAAYMLAEIDPQFGARNAILAISHDGKPLSAEEGPFRVILQGEDHRARWIRMVTKIKLIKVG